MKHPVDTSQWGEFVVGELFDCDTTKTFYPNKSELPPGNTPYITRSTYDNGISGYYDDIDNEFTIEGNCLTIGAEGGIAFWQPKPFIAGVKVYTIRHPQLNKLTALFVTSLLNANSANYSYTNARVLAKIKAESIKLPLKPSADPSNYTQDDIDWNYMETVMSRVTARAKDRLANLPQPTDKKKTPVDTSAWGEFVVGELFETNGNKTYTGAGIPKNNLESGTTPRITVTDKNNGIIGYFNDTNNANYRVYENFISVSFLGTVFWHPYKASVDMKVHVLNKLKNIELNEKRALFLIACIKKTIATFSYAEQLSASKLYDLSIPLPLKPSANPSNYTQEDIDWDYMEHFMQAIENKAHDRLKTLQKSIA